MTSPNIATTTIASSAYDNLFTLPALTTLFTPAPECLTRWVAYGTTEVRSGSLADLGPEMSDVTSQSDYFLSCYPYRGPATYNPGADDYVFCTGTITAPITANVPYTVSSVLGGAAKSYSEDKYLDFPYTLELGVTYVLNSGTVQSTLVSIMTSPTAYNNTTVMTTGYAKADVIWVHWQEKDLSLFPTAYATGLAQIINVPFGGATVSSPALSSASHSSNGNLSTSAKAGVGVASIFGAALIGAIVYLYILRRCRKMISHPGVPEMTGHSLGWKKMLGGRWRAEADATSHPVEVDSRSVRVIPGPPVELDAGGTK